LRALFVGALGLTLLGCSHSPPPLASASSCEETGATNCDAAAPPATPPPAPSLVKRSPAAPVAASSPLPRTAAARASAKVAAPAAGFVDAQANAAEVPAKAEAVSTSPSTSRDAGRTVAAAAEDKDASVGNADAMMAVVMARPDVKSVAELAGKTVAIDDRYAQLGGKVRTAIAAAGATEVQLSEGRTTAMTRLSNGEVPAAIAAAGATEVQLSEGRTTAMTRLSNGEVPAAVVALLTPEAAESFPAISGYKIFHVPLSPRSVKPAR
jgi:hypothetical protein